MNLLSEIHCLLYCYFYSNCYKNKLMNFVPRGTTIVFIESCRIRKRKPDNLVDYRVKSFNMNN